MRRCIFLVALLVGLVGCQSPATKSPVVVGFAPDQVIKALGKPLKVENTATGETWIYRDNPRNPNDYVRLGYRRHVEFDPVRRSNVIIVEPVSDREFPQLRSHTIRITFRDGQVATIESTEDI